MRHVVTELFCHVVLPIPKRTLFTYRIPDALKATCQQGVPVTVPVRKSQRIAIVWRVDTTSLLDEEEIEILPVTNVISATPLLDNALMKLLDWMARYYRQPIGNVVKTVLPGALKDLARTADTADQDRKKPTWILPSEQQKPPELTQEQRVCLSLFQSALLKKEYAPFLLQGVTGSGKTEVYLQATEKVLSQKRQALILVPEIALTEQIIQRFRARFRACLAVLHSARSDKERREEWHRARTGRARVVIGTRSALFVPMPELGLLVIDEEHDPSYKQEEARGVSYHARDMAVVRAHQAGIPLILGSATPSLESMANLFQKRYRSLKLSKRATGALLPTVHLVDLRKEPGASQGHYGSAGFLIGPTLLTAMREELTARRQVLIFLNRRGFAPSLLCRRCGAILRCVACSVALTLHKKSRRLLCHYCGYQEAVRDLCPDCGQVSLAPFGPGTERLEEEIRERLPDARVVRLDRDTVSSKTTHLATTLHDFRDQKIDILLGTQMIAKGHHFPGLSLVGVISAESALSQPDFRATERMFQLISQVGGRAGRERRDHQPTGRVFVQTFEPNHYALQAVVAHDFDAFVATELNYRQEIGYPPYVRMALIRISASRRGVGEAFCRQIHKIHMKNLSVIFSDITMLGPVESPIFKLRHQFRWQILINASTSNRLHCLLDQLMPKIEQSAPSPVRIRLDIDPYGFL